MKAFDLSITLEWMGYDELSVGFYGMGEGEDSVDFLDQLAIKYEMDWHVFGTISLRDIGWMWACEKSKVHCENYAIFAFLVDIELSDAFSRKLASYSFRRNVDRTAVLILQLLIYTAKGQEEFTRKGLQFLAEYYFEDASKAVLKIIQEMPHHSREVINSLLDCTCEDTSLAILNNKGPLITLNDIPRLYKVSLEEALALCNSNNGEIFINDEAIKTIVGIFILLSTADRLFGKERRLKILEEKENEMIANANQEVLQYLDDD